MNQDDRRKYFIPFPELETLRLRLRQLLPSDDQGIFKLRSDPDVNTYLGRELAKSINEARSHIGRINDGVSGGKSLYWVICMKEQQELIGTICLWNFSANQDEAEVGYELLPAFQGMGIMDEALREIIRYAIEDMKLNTILAYTHKLNSKSSRLLTNNKFMAHPVLKDKHDENLVVYFLKNEYFY